MSRDIGFVVVENSTTMHPAYVNDLGHALVERIKRAKAESHPFTGHLEIQINGKVVHDIALEPVTSTRMIPSRYVGANQLWTTVGDSMPSDGVVVYGIYYNYRDTFLVV
jgi:hypothetical protein